MSELRLIMANSDTRQLTSAEISQQAERVEMLLYQLKEEGVCGIRWRLPARFQLRNLGS